MGFLPIPFVGYQSVPLIDILSFYCATFFFDVLQFNNIACFKGQRCSVAYNVHGYADRWSPPGWTTDGCNALADRSVNSRTAYAGWIESITSSSSHDIQAEGDDIQALVQSIQEVSLFALSKDNGMKRDDGTAEFVERCLSYLRGQIVKANSLHMGANIGTQVIGDIGSLPSSGLMREAHAIQTLIKPSNPKFKLLGRLWPPSSAPPVYT